MFWGQSPPPATVTPQNITHLPSLFRCPSRFNRGRKGPLQSYSTQIHLKMLKIWCNTSNFFICTGMCTKNTSCGPRRHLNDAGFVLLMPQGNIMHVTSSFGLNMGQIALLPVLNARFQLKMGLRAPFGPVWRQYRHQTPPKFPHTSK